MRSRGTVTTDLYHFLFIWPLERSWNVPPAGTVATANRVSTAAATREHPSHPAVHTSSACSHIPDEEASVAVVKQAP